MNKHKKTEKLEGKNERFILIDNYKLCVIKRKKLKMEKVKGTHTYTSLRMVMHLKANKWKFVLFRIERM